MQKSVDNNTNDGYFVSDQIENQGLGFHYRKQIGISVMEKESDNLNGNMTLEKIRKVKSHLVDSNEFHDKMAIEVQKMIIECINELENYLNADQISQIKDRIETIPLIIDQSKVVMKDIEIFLERITTKIDAIVWHEKFEQ